MRTVRELLSRTHDPGGWIQAYRAFTCNQCGEECEEGAWIPSFWEDKGLWHPDNLGEPDCENCELSDEIDESKMTRTMDDWFESAYAWGTIVREMYCISSYTIEWWEAWAVDGHTRVQFPTQIADWVLHRRALSHVVAQGPGGFIREAVFQRFEEMDRALPDDLDMDFSDYMLWELELGAAAIVQLHSYDKCPTESTFKLHGNPFVQWVQDLKEKIDVPDSGSEKREDRAGVLL